MAGLKLSLFVLVLLAFGPSQAGPPCTRLCEVRRTGSCARLGEIIIVGSGGGLPCATCNTTGQADENQLGCLPGDLKRLQVAGHSDRSGQLKPLPRLGQLLTLVLGPGNIRTVGRGAFAPVSGISALSMEKNAIKTVGSWFGGITKLEKLALSWNEIEEIKENAFQPLRRLGYLELRHNRLRAVEESHFSSLTKLKGLHLSYNSISHIAGRSFYRLSMLHTLSLDHNKLSFLGTEWLQGLYRGKVYIQENPFRCTCALARPSLSSPCFDNRDRMRCSYPPGLSGRKVDDVARGEMPCPPPAAKVSRRDRGATLVCEVFWEKRPEIGWMDPNGRAVGDRQAQDRCGGTVTTRLEHDYPTTKSPEGGQVLPRDASSLPYIGRSTSTLHMNPQAYQCWTGGSFRCVVKSATTGSVFADLPLTKSSEEDPRHDHTVTTAAGYTSTPAQRNARMTEKVARTPDKNPRQDGITPAADKAERRTAMTAVLTAKPTRQNGRVTGSMGKITDKDGKQDGITSSDYSPLNIMMIVFYSVGIAIVVAIVVDRVVKKCKKWYEERQEQRQNLHGYAAGAIGGIPLQNFQPPAAVSTTGNPVPPQQANDDAQDDASITPYAETSRLENPMYGADVVRPRGATSASPDPRPGPSLGNAPVPPPRSDRPGIAASDSHYYPPGTATTRAKDVPPPQTNRRVNPNVSAQAKRSGKSATRRNRSASCGSRRASCDNRRASYHNRRASYDSQVEGVNLYLDLNGPPHHSGSDMPQAEDVNSSVSAHPKRLGKATLPRTRGRASYDPRSLGVEEEENTEGPNLYLDLNGLKRQSDSEMPQAEDIPDPLPRTNRYVNSNVSAHPQDSDMCQADMIPDPLPRTHTYINCNVSAQPHRLGMFDMPQAERIPDPLPRIHTYVNSNVSAHPQGTDMPQAERIPDPLPRIHTYVNSNVSAEPRHT
ncbi:PREDICTED: uncharacterized protein LOC109462084 [Branchiostoma belcheri]|uniref:Uncharacterized protein LOC109462084 n=1 Tax=Branchiostoma belcheri TaxID=7741 RepID=A0A6P4Y610_BRABE|nr:PREDICTED: uncharacterized protein LOC109462084 [Branchiostoma belcheri]